MTRACLHSKALIAVTTGLSALILAACGSGGSSGGSEDTYKLGINAELSGPLAFYGETIRDGVKAYVEEVNAKGGINGHKIELTVLDNAADASRAATNTTQLATSNKVVGIIGNTLSADCSASTPNAERYKVPMACISVADHGDWVFNAGPDNVTSAGPALNAAKDITKLENPRVAVAFPSTTLTGAALSKRLPKAADDAGVDLVATEGFDLASADLSATTSKIVSSKPDAIVITGTGANFQSILKGVRAAGLDTPLIWIDGTANLLTLTGVDDPAIYAFATYNLTSVDSTEGTAKAYVDAIRPLLKKEPTNGLLAHGNTAVSYLTASAWGNALEACGFPCSGEDLQAELDKTKVDLSPMESGFDYSLGNHYPFPNWYLYQVKKGDQYVPAGSFPADKLDD